MLSLVGSDHVKFGCGASGRCAQQLGADAVRTVMLNPTCSDTSKRLMKPGYPLESLQLQFADTMKGDLRSPFERGDPFNDPLRAFQVGQVKKKTMNFLPLADVLWFTKDMAKDEIIRNVA